MNDQSQPSRPSQHLPAFDREYPAASFRESSNQCIANIRSNERAGLQCRNSQLPGQSYCGVHMRNSGIFVKKPKRPRQPRQPRQPKQPRHQRVSPSPAARQSSKSPSHAARLSLPSPSPAARQASPSPAARWSLPSPSPVVQSSRPHSSTTGQCTSPPPSPTDVLTARKRAKDQWLKNKAEDDAKRFNKSDKPDKHNKPKGL